MEIKKDLDSIISYLMVLDQNEPNTELCKRIDSLIDISQAINNTHCCTEVCESCKQPKEAEAEKYCHYCNSIESV
tara:strand:+ start:95 stop:319 length:225 start_codon:yes stop_codon:yes gene_type:complete